jgi:hypothetical protein
VKTILASVLIAIPCLPGFGVAAALFAPAAWTLSAHAESTSMPTLDAVKSAPGKVVLADGAAAPEGVRLVREWEGGLCRSRLVNGSAEAVRVKEVVLATIPHQLPGETRLYGEGFQMLSQTGGTLAKPVALGSYTDVAHYKLPQSAGATTVYNMLTLSPPGGGHVLVGFASCRRFVGKFNVREASIEAVIETEDLALAQLPQLGRLKKIFARFRNRDRPWRGRRRGWPRGGGTKTPCSENLGGCGRSPVT